MKRQTVYTRKEDPMSDAMIVGIIFGSILIFVKMLSDNSLRHKLIEKNMVDENVKYLYASKMDHLVPSSLKWGFVCVGIGLAVLIGQIVPSDMEEEITVGSIFILAGVGFLLYFFVARNMLKKAAGK